MKAQLRWGGGGGTLPRWFAPFFEETGITFKDPVRRDLAGSRFDRRSCEFKCVGFFEMPRICSTEMLESEGHYSSHFPVKSAVTVDDLVRQYLSIYIILCQWEHYYHYPALDFMRVIFFYRAILYCRM